MSTNLPRITESDLHAHIKARMEQRGVDFRELQAALEEGWQATDAREGSYGKTIVFKYGKEWEGSFYEEKEVTVYYKPSQGGIILLTIKARYGAGFKRGGNP